MVKAICVWFYGLSGSGKTTIADKLVGKFKSINLPVERLDGDIVREFLTKDLGFTIKDRFEHIRRIVYVTKILMRNGINVIASFITPLRAMRYYIQRELGDKCLLVECKCSIETCMERDPKGLYKKALDGIIDDFTGLTQKYERPRTDVFCYLNTDSLEPEQSLEDLIETFKCFKVFEYLMKNDSD